MNNKEKLIDLLKASDSRYESAVTYLASERELFEDNFTITEMAWFNDTYSNCAPTEVIDALDKDFSTSDAFYYEHDDIIYSTNDEIATYKEFFPYELVAETILNNLDSIDLDFCYDDEMTEFLQSIAPHKPQNYLLRIIDEGSIIFAILKTPNGEKSVEFHVSEYNNPSKADILTSLRLHHDADTSKFE